MSERENKPTMSAPFDWRIPPQEAFCDGGCGRVVGFYDPKRVNRSDFVMRCGECNAKEVQQTGDHFVAQRDGKWHDPDMWKRVTKMEQEPDGPPRDWPSIWRQQLREHIERAPMIPREYVEEALASIDFHVAAKGISGILRKARSDEVKP